MRRSEPVDPDHGRDRGGIGHGHVRGPDGLHHPARAHRVVGPDRRRAGPGSAPSRPLGLARPAVVGAPPRRGIPGRGHGPGRRARRAHHILRGGGDRPGAVGARHRWCHAPLRCSTGGVRRGHVQRWPADRLPERDLLPAERAEHTHSGEHLPGPASVRGVGGQRERRGTQRVGRGPPRPAPRERDPGHRRLPGLVPHHLRVHTGVVRLPVLRGVSPAGHRPLPSSHRRTGDGRPDRRHRQDGRHQLRLRGRERLLQRTTQPHRRATPRAISAMPPNTS